MALQYILILCGFKDKMIGNKPSSLILWVVELQCTMNSASHHYSYVKIKAQIISEEDPAKWDEDICVNSYKAENLDC